VGQYYIGDDSIPFGEPSEELALPLSLKLSLQIKHFRPVFCIAWFAPRKPPIKQEPLAQTTPT
jgi:hypothetical protein